MSSEQAAQAFDEALLEDDPVQLYERAPCGYLSTTPEGRIVKANATFCTWMGYDADELTARSFVDLLSAGGRIYHETHYAPLLRLQTSVREIALELVRKDGRRLPVLVNARLHRDELGEPRVVRIAVFDATERRQYERELLRAKELAEASEGRARSLARTLQQTLIPPSPPTIPDLDLAAAYRPAGDGTEVGGDFYDVFPLAAGDWMVVLGDVCGKGAEAAVVTALARYTVRALAVSLARPSEVLAQLDEAVRRHESDRFCTAVLVRLRRNPDGWSATVSSGGHPPPMLLRPGRAPCPVDVHGSLVGALPEATFEDVHLRLGAGEGLLLYTDGVTEARGAAGFFGEGRMLASVDRHVHEPSPGLGDAVDGLAARLVTGLVDEVVAFQSGRPRDDIAVLGLAVPGTVDVQSE